MKKEIKKIKVDFPIKGSLGFLAHGDIAHREWRKVKSKAKKDGDAKKK